MLNNIKVLETTERDEWNWNNDGNQITIALQRTSCLHQDLLTHFSVCLSVNYSLVSRLPSVTSDHGHYILWLDKKNKKNKPETWEIKSNLIRGKKRISKTEESLSSLTGAPLHINERLGRNYILVPVIIHMPNYNIFIKWECNFHKGDYKLSTRSGKALFVLGILLGWWCWCGTGSPRFSIFFFFPGLGLKRGYKEGALSYILIMFMKTCTKKRSFSKPVPLLIWIQMI